MAMQFYFMPGAIAILQSIVELGIPSDCSYSLERTKQPPMNHGSTRFLFAALISVDDA